jgi:antitoxin (DNA-binding transcriptional repressor) of toxin-antitoxin stability system
LSAYLADVRAGGEVVVCDRETPIARLVPVETNDDVSIIPASTPAASLKKVAGVRPKASVDVDGLLRELRRDR